MTPQVINHYIGPNIERARLIQIRLCTCPNCHTVWAHQENPGRASYDLQRTKEKFGNSHDIWTCSECGERSVAHVLPEKGRVAWTIDDDIRHGLVPKQKGR